MHLQHPQYIWEHRSETVDESEDGADSVSSICVSSETGLLMQGEQGLFFSTKSCFPHTLDVEHSLRIEFKGFRVD